MFFHPVSTKVLRDGRHDLKVALWVALKSRQGVIGDGLVVIILPGLVRGYFHSWQMGIQKRPYCCRGVQSGGEL